MSLQVFEQGHEVPDREYVVGHEYPQVFQGVQRSVDRVPYKLFPEREYVLCVECGHGSGRSGIAGYKIWKGLDNFLMIESKFTF